MSVDSLSMLDSRMNFWCLLLVMWLMVVRKLIVVCYLVLVSFVLWVNECRCWMRFVIIVCSCLL